MTLDLETLAILQKAAIQSQGLETTGLEITEEVRAAFELLQGELSSAPEGSMAYIVDDVPWGKYDALIAATEKAHGPILGGNPVEGFNQSEDGES